MTIGWGMREGRWDSLLHLQYTSSLNLSKRESVIVSPVITVPTSRKKGEIKTMLVLTRLSCSLIPWIS